MTYSKLYLRADPTIQNPITEIISDNGQVFANEKYMTIDSIILNANAATILNRDEYIFLKIDFLPTESISYDNIYQRSTKKIAIPVQNNSVLSNSGEELVVFCPQYPMNLVRLNRLQGQFIDEIKVTFVDWNNTLLTFETGAAVVPNQIEVSFYDEKPIS